MSTTTTRQRPTMSAPVMAPEERQALAKQTGREAGGGRVAAFFEANKVALGRMLPQHMQPDRFLRIALNALRTTPKLMDCTVESLFAANLACAQLGLEPNTPLGHIYLIPFKNNRKGITEVQVIVGYQGYVKLARNSGEMQTIAAQPVFLKDDFSFDYLNPEASYHKPFMNGDRGDVIGAWAMAKFKDGGMAFEFMPRADIDRIRNGSQGYRSAERNKRTDTPWHTNYDQMAAKTAIRRLSKRLPLSIEMAAAISMDERDDRRSSQGMDRAMREALDIGSFDLNVISSGQDEDEGAGDERPPSIVDPSTAREAEPEAEQDEPDAGPEQGAAPEAREAPPPPPAPKPMPKPKAAAPAPAPSDDLDFGS